MSTPTDESLLAAPHSTASSAHLIAAPSTPSPPLNRPAAATWLVLPMFAIAVPVVSWQLLALGLPKPLASGAPIIVTLVVLLLLERVFPLHREWNRRPDGLDLLLLVGNRAVDVAVMAASLALVAHLGEPLRLLKAWPTAWPVTAQVLLGIVIAELVRYGIHRYSHRPGFWWRVHRLHHEPDRMYSLNGPRLHPLNFLWVSAANSVPMLLMGAQLEVTLLVINTTAVFVIFQHANLNLRFDGLNRWLATPDVHRLHHAKNAPAAGTNFSIVLLVIDRVFGTFSAATEPLPRDAIGLSPDPK